MARKKRLHSSLPLDQELSQPRDPLGSLPNTCTSAILENFTAVELIGLRRVSRGWKDAVDWTLAGIVRKCRPKFAEGVDDGEATLEFCRDIFRQQARSDGRPTLVRMFTYATQGFAMCGDYFCWIDDACLNTQRVLGRNKTGSPSPVEIYRLKELLGANSLSVECVKSQEVGSMTDRPLLMIKYAGNRRKGEPRNTRMAVVCVKTGTALWSTADDMHPHSSTPWGKLATLNHTTIAYITNCQHSLRPILYVRDILTGDIKAAKLIPADLLLSLSQGISFKIHPRRDLVYIAVRRKAFLFSTTTGNCVGRLSVARVFSIGSNCYQCGPLRFRFSENQPECSSSAREKFFLYQYNKKPDFQAYYCFEYETPTDEEISISEARILQNGSQRSQENLIFKVLRVQIYERGTRHREGPLELNPMLKQLAHTEIRSYGDRHTQIRFYSFTRHCPLPENAYGIFLESGKPHDGSIPIEFYPRGNTGVLVTKPEKTLAPLGRVRYDARADCLLPEAFAAVITLTERYMFLMDLGNVYLFAYEPGW